MATKTPKPTKPTAKPQPEANGAAAPEVMTLAEAAAWLRVSEQGLKADAVAGRIPGRLVAGEWRFNKAALLVWFCQPELQAGKSSKERMLSAFGAWKDFGEDPEEMIAALRRARKAVSAKKE
jgi:hypothetical protein